MIDTRNELVYYQLLLPGVHNEGKVQQGEDTDPAENIDIYYLSTVVLLSLERQHFNSWISFEPHYIYHSAVTSYPSLPVPPLAVALPPGVVPLGEPDSQV